MNKEWKSHQAYFTRAQRQKFSPQSGYGIVDASAWFDETRASRYIEPIGLFTLFDYKNTIESMQNGCENESMYLVLPSSDGYLSITRAFDTVDGQSPPRFTPFMHTYLMEPQDARICLRDNMFSADATRVSVFAGSYTGQPGRGGFDTEYVLSSSLLGGELPGDLCLADVGFTPEYMLRLLNTIICINKKTHPNLKRVFVVYNCRREEFLIKARRLLTLVYSCLPYSVTSNMGAVIKTDSVWRNDIPTAYATTYVRDQTEIRYFPGVELFIVNGTVETPDKCQLFTVNDGLDIAVSREIAIDAPSRDLLNDMVCTLDEVRNPDNSLRAFYTFMHSQFEEDLHFDELCQFYGLFVNMRHPEGLAGLSRRDLQIQIRALADCFKQSPNIKDPIAKMRLGDFFAGLFARTSALAQQESISEQFWIRLLELVVASKTSYVHDLYGGFIAEYYRLLTESAVRLSGCPKLRNLIMDDAGLFESLAESDKDNLLFGEIYSGAMNDCSLNSLSLLSQRFAGRAGDDLPRLFTMVSALYYTHGEKDVADAARAVRSAGLENEVRFLLLLLKMNLSDAAEFKEIMGEIRQMGMTGKLKGLLSFHDGWTARIYLDKLRQDCVVSARLIAGYAAGYQAVLDKGRQDEISSLEHIIGEWFGSREDVIALLMRYQAKSCVPQVADGIATFDIDWKKLVRDATGVAGQTGQSGQTAPLCRLNAWVATIQSNAEEQGFLINLDGSVFDVLFEGINGVLTRVGYEEVMETCLTYDRFPLLNSLSTGVSAAFMLQNEFAGLTHRYEVPELKQMKYSRIKYCRSCNTPFPVNRPDANRPDTSKPDANRPDGNRLGTNRPEVNRPDASKPDKGKCSECGARFDDNAASQQNHAMLVYVDAGILGQILRMKAPEKKSLLQRIVPPKQTDKQANPVFKEERRQGYVLHKVLIRSCDDRGLEAYWKYIRNACPNTTVIINYANRAELEGSGLSSDDISRKKCILAVRENECAYPVTELAADGSCCVFHAEHYPGQLIEKIAAFLAFGGVWL